VTAWRMGYTGYLSTGLSIAGTLAGAILGALAGSGVGPEGRLIRSDGQRSITVSDYNRKLVALIPMLAGAGLSVGATMISLNDPQHKDAQFLIGAAVVCALIAIGSLVYLAFQDLSVTFGDEISVNRLFSKKRFLYRDISSAGLLTRAGAGPPFPEGQDISFYMVFLGYRINMPVSKKKAEELHLLLGDYMGNKKTAS